MIPVILSGGSGTRLWPLSREGFPKQFLSLMGGDTMLQATWNRVKSVASASPIVVAGEEHRFMVAEQLREAGCPNPVILLEPVGRNTAPAIAVAALEAISNGGDPLLLVLPSDHVIADLEAFQAALLEACTAAETGQLVTFGIVPTAPETGYGYIQSADGEGVKRVERFVEKPDAATAEAYVASGCYFWNSGMFLFKASAYLDALATHQPAMLDASRAALAKARRETDFVRLDRTAFEASPSDSIDYAVMEKTDSAAVLPIDVGWNDVGSWSALWEVAEQDSNGNAHHGDVLAEQCRNTLAWSDQRLVALLGLEDVVVVDTADAVLVAHKDKVQDIKGIVGKLKAAGRSEPSAHRKVYRPWGNYDSIDVGGRFQVKRITVKPGAQLSLQMHHHRAEHWIVVSGTGRVTRGEEIIMLSENQSTYIPLGVKHRLENPGVVPLELIEVQSGSYLGEDDIVRFDDVYGRG
ncbi:mannose-1-phosphate guanylyltransferase/mannose-6-phosphate isomerase [Lysobacter soyae]|uniref:mannose-1-phosphate guanylyltransferase n=1 Tax=Lysobacter soyae TaxID=2764185 RepID=A0ABX8WL72_9GAMM|nr:mannose-1-phosphate guanylyltransferase/mannose-6-phosphate isomerase [Lysobacter sp. CJ11]QYR52139.1 mannose-1-phosphate guanylyltransferase/mannose-6-phosphate isomerase [Lysobacter sp. CJ11]